MDHNRLNANKMDNRKKIKKIPRHEQSWKNHETKNHGTKPGRNRHSEQINYQE